MSWLTVEGVRLVAALCVGLTLALTVLVVAPPEHVAACRALLVGVLSAL